MLYLLFVCVEYYTGYDGGWWVVGLGREQEGFHFRSIVGYFFLPLKTSFGMGMFAKLCTIINEINKCNNFFFYFQRMQRMFQTLNLYKI